MALLKIHSFGSFGEPKTILFDIDCYYTCLTYYREYCNWEMNTSNVNFVAIIRLLLVTVCTIIDLYFATFQLSFLLCLEPLGESFASSVTRYHCLIPFLYL